MYRRLAAAIASIGLAAGLVACGGGGSDGGPSLPESGFNLPTEISAVPTSPGSGTQSLQGQLLSLSAATDSGTDYSNAVTTKFVEERTLDQFEIIEQIMKALAQTHYADPENVNQGPYKAMIAWQENRNGLETKSLEPWTIESSTLLEGGVPVNRVQVWIEEPDEQSGTRQVKAEFKISASATKNEDGSYLNYGVWRLNVKFGEDATEFFAAEASVGGSGESILKIHERMTDGGGLQEVRAIMNKSDALGFGRVLYPDWSDCSSPDCGAAPVTAKYAYDADFLAVQTEGDAVVYKDRHSVTDLTHRYGLFDSATGDNVLKSKSFGFPVQYLENGIPRYAYYGAWQGRHHLWSQEGGVPAGTVVTRQDYGSNQTPELFTVSPPFVGTLTKRSLVAAEIDDILNIPVETWVNVNLALRFDGADWIDCRNPDFSTVPSTCGAESALFADFSAIAFDPNNRRKWVNIYRWDSLSNMSVSYVYDPNGGSGSGFYEAVPDPETGQFVSNGSLFSPVSGDEMWINIGGSIYVEYTGTGATGWFEKKLVDFDESSWTPLFDSGGDTPYAFPLNRELYINNSGANYVVTRTGEGVYDVKIELQSVANPVNTAAVVPLGAIFKPQWQDTGNSTYEFITSPGNPNFLKLVYATVGANDANLNANVGDVVTQGQWGLVAFVNDVSTGTQFNWDYPRQDESGDWGITTYLIDANNAYRILDDPILLEPLTVLNNAGTPKTLSLQFDGWMHGLPNLYEDLRRNDFVMTPAIAAKVINIPAGTEVGDALLEGKSYLIKPLEVSQFLDVVSTPSAGLDISLADAVDLATVPDYVDHGMGPMPIVNLIKYSEGIPIQ